MSPLPCIPIIVAIERLRLVRVSHAKMVVDKCVDPYLLI
jgi:hypothetical protein